MDASQKSTPLATFWMLTIAHKDWEKPETIKGLPGVRYIRGQIEYSPSQFLHWQLVVQFFEPVSFVKVKEVFSQKAHVETTYSKASWSYVWKDETAIKETRFELGDNSIVSSQNSVIKSPVQDHQKGLQEWMDIDKLKAKLEYVTESLYFLPREGLYSLWNAANGAEGLLKAECLDIPCTPSKVSPNIGLLTPPEKDIETSNQGKRWKPEDLEELKTMLQSNFTIEDIAMHFKRTSRAIVARASSMIHEMVKTGVSMDDALKVFNNKITQADMAVHSYYQSLELNYSTYRNLQLLPTNALDILFGDDDEIEMDKLLQCTKIRRMSFDYTWGGWTQERKDMLEQVRIPAILQNLLEWKRLKQFCIKGLSFNAQILKEQLPFTVLTELAVCDTTDVGSLLSVIHMTKIEKLELYQCSVSDEDILTLVYNLEKTKLQYLKLSDNNISDIGAIALAQVLPHSNIEQLYLSNNRIEYDGVEALMEAIPVSKLDFIDLHGNAIDNTDFNYLRVENILYSKSDRLWIDAMDDRVYDAYCRNISKSNIVSVILEIPTIYLENVLTMSCNSKIEAMTINCDIYGSYSYEVNQQFNSILKEKIRQLPIEHLTIKQYDCLKGFSEIITGLNKVSTLTDINLQMHYNCKPSSESIGLIAKHLPNTSIKSLRIEYGEEWNDENIQELLAFLLSRSLEKLEVEGCGWTIEAIIGFVERAINLVPENSDLQYVTFTESWSSRKTKNYKNDIVQEGRSRVENLLAGKSYNILFSFQTYRPPVTNDNWT
ncbi:hypothetical protein HK103_000446 [Boothiomyces macroporosus]|uniref:CRESS-DNA virus Rep endonuclease domain-containing protein n=1 Tax=Boothiomyces macroporosus TaxID=261099 RepID=A0AAD5Y5K8_9FUNG|nr:hypothetical protein HK103_000446 [Boothiomyces macroporosus]